MDSFRGCGLGLRECFADEITAYADRVDFLEIVPENWMQMNRFETKRFGKIREHFPIIAHGLSLSLGDTAHLDRKHLENLKEFLDRWEIGLYSEHLSFTSLAGIQSHELLPLPMTPKMAEEVVAKIDEVQEILKRPLVIENPTYYMVYASSMDEVTFITDILRQSGAKLLLDINNLYINAFNHRFDASKFLESLDPLCVSYCHVAGHLEYREDLLIDTHGMPVKEEVWDLLVAFLKREETPVLLERDNNIPPLHQLMEEFDRMRRVYEGAVRGR